MKAADWANEEAEPANLTPMIDMVFQLIIFFVIVNDFSSTQLEPLILPKAQLANTEKDRDKSRSVVINILAGGEVKINRVLYGGPDIDEKILKDHMQILAELAGMEENPESKGKMVSKLRAVIRADQDCPYEHVQKVMKACALNGVYKTLISAYKEPLNRAGS